MAAMHAARFPHKVASLVLPGSPIDAAAGEGPIKQMANTYPMSLYERLVAQGDGLMLGRFMLAGWKGMHLASNTCKHTSTSMSTFLEKTNLEKIEQFEGWYEHPLDLPGRWYLQVSKLIFKGNLSAKGAFVALGKPVNLKAITCPVFLLAGIDDDITPQEQVFGADGLVGTPRDQIVKRLTPRGHVGLFIGSSTLRDVWPDIARWIGAAK